MELFGIVETLKKPERMVNIQKWEKAILSSGKTKAIKECHGLDKKRLKRRMAVILLSPTMCYKY